jgi:hypothetical protein
LGPAAAGDSEALEARGFRARLAVFRTGIFSGISWADRAAVAAALAWVAVVAVRSNSERSVRYGLVGAAYSSTGVMAGKDVPVVVVADRVADFSYTANRSESPRS